MPRAILSTMATAISGSAPMRNRSSQSHGTQRCSQWETRELSPLSYGVAEGMRSSECNSGRRKPGRAVMVCHQARRWWLILLRNSIPPPVVLEEASANQLKIGRVGHTSIPPGNNTFDFAFTALSLSARRSNA